MHGTDPGIMGLNKTDKASALTELIFMLGNIE